MKRMYKAWAFFKRDLIVDWSYKLSFALEALHILIFVAAFYFLARFVGSRTVQGYESFPFILIGLAVNAYMTTCLVCFTQVIRGNQVTGTLKAVLVSRTSPTQFLAFSSIYPFARATLDAAVYGAGGLAFGLSLARVNPVATCLLFAASLLAFSSVGLLSATFILIFKRGDPLLWLFGSGSWLLGGVMYPTDVLPRWLQRLGEFFPITHALKGLRATMLSDAPVASVIPELTVLVLFAAIGLPISIAAFNFGLRRARVTGTIGHQ
jgi:ABC-2 type transport system permease protein